MMVKVQAVYPSVPAVDPEARGFVVQKILFSDATAERWHVSYEQELLQLTLHLGGVICFKGEGFNY